MLKRLWKALRRQTIPPPFTATDLLDATITVLTIDPHRAPFPHCDDLVLHSPDSNCWACNHYPDRQATRLALGINFTGEHDPEKSTCPAEQRRPLETINRWYNNTSRTQAQADLDHEDYQRELARLLDGRGVTRE